MVATTADQTQFWQFLQHAQKHMKCQSSSRRLLELISFFISTNIPNECFLRHCFWCFYNQRKHAMSLKFTLLLKSRSQRIVVTLANLLVFVVYSSVVCGDPLLFLYRYVHIYYISYAKYSLSFFLLPHVNLN